jgi:hypothetical protein
MKRRTGDTVAGIDGRLARQHGKPSWKPPSVKVSSVGFACLLQLESDRVR